MAVGALYRRTHVSRSRRHSSTTVSAYCSCSSVQMRARTDRTTPRSIHVVQRGMIPPPGGAVAWSWRSRRTTNGGHARKYARNVCDARWVLVADRMELLEARTIVPSIHLLPNASRRARTYRPRRRHRADAQLLSTPALPTRPQQHPETGSPLRVLDRRPRSYPDTS